MLAAVDVAFVVFAFTVVSASVVIVTVQGAFVTYSLPAKESHFSIVFKQFNVYLAFLVGKKCHWNQ